MSNSFKSLLSDQVIALEWGTALKDVLCLFFLKMHFFKWKQKCLYIFAEGSCDNFKTDVVLLITPMFIVKYFRKKKFFKISWPELNLYIMRQTAFLVTNPTSVDSYASHFNRTTAGLASMTAWK